MSCLNQYDLFTLASEIIENLSQYEKSFELSLFSVNRARKSASFIEEQVRASQSCLYLRQQSAELWVSSEITWD